MALHQLSLHHRSGCQTPSRSPSTTRPSVSTLRASRASSPPTEGGRQLFLETAPTRRLVQLVVGVDDEDDLARARAALEAAGHPVDTGASSLIGGRAQLRRARRPRGSAPR